MTMPRGQWTAEQRQMAERADTTQIISCVRWVQRRPQNRQPEVRAAIEEVLTRSFPTHSPYIFAPLRSKEQQAAEYLALADELESLYHAMRDRAKGRTLHKKQVQRTHHCTLAHSHRSLFRQQWAW